MGKEPYNQPIRIFLGSNPEPWQPLSELMRRRRTVRDREGGRSIDAKVGELITGWRMRLGYSIDQLARRTRMPISRLRMIEAGKERLTLFLVQRIAAKLGCEVTVQFWPASP